MPMIFNHFSFSCSIQYLCFLFSTTFHSWRKNGILVYYLCSLAPCVFRVLLSFLGFLFRFYDIYCHAVLSFLTLLTRRYLLSSTSFCCSSRLLNFLVPVLVIHLLFYFGSYLSLSRNCAYPTISHVWFSSLPLSPVVSTSLCLFSQPALPTCLVSLCYSLYALVLIQIPLLDIFACFL